MFADRSTENDPLFPDEILDFGRKSLAENNTEHEIKTYSGVPHGKCRVLTCLKIGLTAPKVLRW